MLASAAAIASRRASLARDGKVVLARRQASMNGVLQRNLKLLVMAVDQTLIQGC
jgi:hypothetical protein